MGDQVFLKVYPTKARCSLELEGSWAFVMWDIFRSSSILNLLLTTSLYPRSSRVCMMSFMSRYSRGTTLILIMLFLMMRYRYMLIWPIKRLLWKFLGALIRSYITRRFPWWKYISSITLRKKQRGSWRIKWGKLSKLIRDKFRDQVFLSGRDVTPCPSLC